MKSDIDSIMINYSLLLAKKFFIYEKKYYPDDENKNNSQLIKLFSIRNYSLNEYKNGLRNFKLNDMELNLEEKKMILLLYGISLYQKNGVNLWHVASFFHKTPARGLKFINRVIDPEKPLLLKKAVMLDNTDFPIESMNITDIGNFYNTRRVFLSPHTLSTLFELAAGNQFLGFPAMELTLKYKNIDDVIADITGMMRYLFFFANFCKVIYTPSNFKNEDLYAEGDFASSIEKLKNAILQSGLKIELVDLLKKNNLSNLEFIFLIYLIYKVTILKEFIISSIEDLLNALTFTANQIKTILKCFGQESVFVSEGIIEYTDYFQPAPFLEDESEMDELDQIIERDDYLELPFDFNSITISKERIFRLIFTDASGEKSKIKSKIEASELSSARDKEKIKVKGLYDIIVPNVGIENVILDDDVKKDLLNAIDMTKTVEVMKEWEVKPSLSASSYSSIKILLYGASGTGKTITAEALAHEAEAELFKVDASNLVTSWVGESAKNVKKVFIEFYKYQKKSGKKVFMFFNEADQLLSARGAVMQAADKEYNQMQNILLEELENFDGVFMATTNLINLFDTAWNRRFNIKIKFDIPKYKTRLALWKVHIPNKLPLSPDVDFKKLAETELAGGSIANVVYNAARKAALREESNRVVTQKDFLDAIQHEINSQVGGKKNRVGFS